MNRLLALSFALVASLHAGETLYNGIVLPDEWPPRRAEVPADPETPPYLKSPPKVIAIDVGRQLFVDDFLIESTTMKRSFHTPVFHPATPVMKADQPWEQVANKPGTMPFSDGVWWDPQARLFKMWYYAGHGAGQTCYATSTDGIQWDKPKLDVVPGTNIVQKGGRDSNTIWLDLNAPDPEQRYKMGVYAGGGMFSLQRSADGIHWTKAGPGSKTGDRSTFFYNPFRERWVFSIRSSSKRGRSRDYWETKDFFSFTPEVSEKKQAVPWMVSDTGDWKRDDLKSQPQLYNVDCAAYESVMIGLFAIWRGDYRNSKASPQAQELDKAGRPKQNSLCIGFSRDGFHWDRANRQPFVATSEKAGDWNWGNVQSVGGCCLVVGDELWFYVSGRAGKSFPGCVSHDAASSTGLAVLRRDGFASMDATNQEATLTTRPLRFGGKHLFVNLAAPKGELRAEVLDENDHVIAPYTLGACEPVTGDKARLALKWKGADDVAALAGRNVKLRFHLTNGSLYSFWVSADGNGASNGYVAAGGPGFTGPKDTTGK